MKKTSIKTIKTTLLDCKEAHFNLQEHNKDLGIKLNNEEIDIMNKNFVFISDSLSFVNWIKDNVKGARKRAVFIGNLESKLDNLPFEDEFYKNNILDKLHKFIELKATAISLGINELFIDEVK